MIHIVEINFIRFLNQRQKTGDTLRIVSYKKILRVKKFFQANRALK